jgi:thiamine pyrophosphokinase
MANRTDTLWEPFKCIDNAEKNGIALIKLNTPFSNHQKIFRILWQKALFRIVVDGASNVLYKCLDMPRDEFLPHVISGDFDSAEPNVLEYYRSKGVEIIPTPEQNETDFTKALRIVCSKLNSNKIKISCICAHVSFDGRFDHVLANVNTLFLAKKICDLPLYLISEDSVAFVVDKGKCSVTSSWQGSWCGLIPINGPCRSVTTTGLKYNLDHQGMAFGELVSTSNTIVEDIITIDTDNVLLMTIGMTATKSV